MYNKLHDNMPYILIKVYFTASDSQKNKNKQM